MFGRLFFDNEMFNFLNTTANTKISWILLNASASGSLINEEGNFIKRSKIEGNISYLPKSKLTIESDFSVEKGRVNIKIGRFVSKFLSEHSMKEFNVTSSDVEFFVNLFKSYFTPNKENIKVVDGEEILKWYLEDNYALSFGNRCGSLWNSCMRQRERNKFMRLYAKNPESVKMLIFLDDEGKLRSRALLWQEVVDRKGITYKVMDRVYSIYDQDIYLFKSWAKENGYITKLEQSAKCESLFDINGTIVEIDCYVTLKNHELSYYPYLDTFKFYNPYNGQFSNSYRFDHVYKLVQSSGLVEPPREELSYDEEEYSENIDNW